MEKKKIILGSASPRRQELLKKLGFEFTVATIDCPEVYPPELPPADIAGYLSKLKSESYDQLNDGELLITADTVVVLNDRILGKPADADEAYDMLYRLSGTIHQVYTGVTIRSTENTVTATDFASVEFDEFTSTEIKEYIKDCKPFDKAGAYGIQEWAGMAKMKYINGSFYTIMGLPTHLVYTILKDFGQTPF